jgi:hypothetical protein
LGNCQQASAATSEPAPEMATSASKPQRVDMGALAAWGTTISAPLNTTWG